MAKNEKAIKIFQLEAKSVFQVMAVVKGLTGVHVTCVRTDLHSFECCVRTVKREAGDRA